MGDDGCDVERDAEMELLRSMFVEDEELFFPDPEELYLCILKFTVDADDGAEPVTCELTCILPSGYPTEPAEVSVNCERVRRVQNDRAKAALGEALRSVGEGEMHTLFAMQWAKEHLPEYFAQEVALSSVPSGGTGGGKRQPQGFMREWCSFVSLYKDSYISGPTRFEVMTNLACKRGLNITGMGIAGKPGGMVVEGEEGDMVEFMELMRTEFFETLNPRGRKLTTRWQERWPLDDEQDRYEAAEVMHRIHGDFYRAADREKGLVKKPGERERLEKLEGDERARLRAWEQKAGRSMQHDEVERLMKAGPPAKCTTPAIYDRCGCEQPPSREEVNAKRLFKDFTVFTGKEGFEASYQDAAKIFKDMGQMEGFDAMFTYRFS